MTVTGEQIAVGIIAAIIILWIVFQGGAWLAECVTDGCCFICFCGAACCPKGKDGYEEEVDEEMGDAGLDDDDDDDSSKPLDVDALDLSSEKAKKKKRAQERAAARKNKV